MGKEEKSTKKWIVNVSKGRVIRKHRNNAHNLNIRNEIQISSQIQKTRLFPVHIIVYNRPIEKNYKIQMTARKKAKSST